jgi:hypothetical protein
MRPLSEARAAELAGITLAHLRHLTDPSDQWQGRGILTPLPTPAGPVFDPMEVEAFAEFARDPEPLRDAIKTVLGEEDGA